jgi:hypothetical protein
MSNSVTSMRLLAVLDLSVPEELYWKTMEYDSQPRSITNVALHRRGIACDNRLSRPIQPCPQLHAWGAQQLQSPTKRLGILMVHEELSSERVHPAGLTVPARL